MVEAREKHTSTGNNVATYLKKAVCDVCGTEYGAKLVDSTPPTGKIEVGTNSWEKFLNKVSFGLFFKDYKYIVITATDAELGVQSREYYLSETAVSFEDIQKSDIEWKTYTERVKIEPNNKYFVYAKITDKAGNVTYIDTDGIVLDNVAPTFSVTVGTDTFDDLDGRYYFITGEKAQSYAVNDELAGIDKVEYLDSADELEESELSAATGWQTLTDGDKLPYQNGTTYNRYYRAVDKSGNVAYVYLGTVICYKDYNGGSIAAEYTYGSKSDVKAEAELEGTLYWAYKYIAQFDKLTLGDGTGTYDADYSFYDLTAKQGIGLELSGGKLIESILEKDNTVTDITLQIAPAVTAGTDFFGDIPSDIPVKITIKPTNGEVKITSDISKTYNGDAVAAPTYDKLGNGAVTIEYKVKGADDSTYTTVAPKNAGEYTVRVSVAQSQPYKAAAATADFTVSKASFTAEVKQNGELTYNGTEQTANVTAIPSGVKGGQEVTYKYGLTENECDSATVPAFKNAGTYTVYFVATANNHNEARGSFSVKIAPKTLTAGDFGYTGAALHKVYDGTTVASLSRPIIITAVNGLEGTDSSPNVTVLSANFDSANAGDRTLAVSIEGNSVGNYVWSAGIVNIDAEILVKGVLNSQIILSKDSFDYTGGKHEPAVTVKDGDAEIPASEYTVVYTDNINAGTATVTVTDKEGGNYDVSGSTNFVINKTDYPVTWPQNLEGKQGETLSTVELSEGFTWDNPDEVIKYSSNTYAMTYTPDDIDNYNGAKAEIAVNGLDVTFPTGEIALKENKWNAFLNNITFGLFFKETQSVSITAADTESGVKEIAYYLAAEELSADEVKALENSKWTVYTDAFNIEPDNKYVVYARITDNAGNIIYINSDGIVLDSIKPIIVGVEDNTSIYGDATFTVDEEYLDTVTLDGEPIEVTEGKYSIPADNKEHTIVVTDKTGNRTEYKLAVYKTYTVTYVADGKEVSVQQVGHGLDAEAPAIPAKEGHTAKWSQDGKEISGDLTIVAEYTKIPATGDLSNPYLWATVLMLSVVTVAITVISKKRKTA